MNLMLVLMILLITTIECKLYQVVSMFRHGAIYHSNSFYDGNSTKEMWGQITSVGMRQHQTLGQIIRNQYINGLQFLSDKFNKSQIQVFSTQYNRSIQSAISQLYGLYPPGNGPKLVYVERKYHLPPFSNTTDLDEQNFALPQGHQPIKVQFNNKIILKDNCPNFNKQVQKNIASRQTEYQQMNLTYAPFLGRMTTLFNLTDYPLNLSSISELQSNLRVDRYLNRLLPSELTEDDYNNIEHLHNWYQKLHLIGNLSKMINSYKFSHILSVFDNRIKSPRTYPLKWTFLSVDETDLVPAMIQLNLSSSKCIEDLYRKGTTTELNCQPDSGFASSIFFQLYSDNEKDYYVMIRYNGKYMNTCGEKNTKCSYNTWKKLVQKTIMTQAEVQKTCGIKTAKEQILIVEE